MKYFQLLFVLIFLSCQTPGRKQTAKDKPANQNTITTNMEQKQAQDPSEGLRVDILVTQTESYCGGAAPSKEVEDRLFTPVPLGGKKMFLKKGSVNNPDQKALAEFTTSRSGTIMTYLPEGTYLLVDEKKATRDYYKKLAQEYAMETKNFKAINMQCLDEWVATPDLVFTVAKGKPLSVSVNYNKDCEWKSVPCAKYKGMLPQ